MIRKKDDIYIDTASRFLQGNDVITPVPVKQPSRIWTNKS